MTTKTDTRERDLQTALSIARKLAAPAPAFIRRGQLSHHLQVHGLFSLYARQVHGVWQLLGDILGADGWEKVIVDLGREVTEDEAKDALRALVHQRLGVTAVTLLARLDLSVAALDVLLRMIETDGARQERPLSYAELVSWLPIAREVAA